jgi:hypothetical protein
MVAVDQDHNDANALIWDGSSWVGWRQITGSISSTVYECAALAYEYGTGNIMAVAGQGSLVAWTRYTGSWSTPVTFDINPSTTLNMRWLALRTHRVAASNRLMLLSHDAANVASGVDWTGSSWGSVNILDDMLETTDSRCLDGDWEPSGEKLIAAGGRMVDVLDTSASIFTDLAGYRDQRDAEMRPYVLIAYLGSVVFLAVSWVILVRFMGPLSASSSDPLLAQGGILRNLLDMDYYKSILFWAAVMEAVIGGLVAGKIRYGRINGGLIHSAILMAMTVAVFNAF